MNGFFVEIIGSRSFDSLWYWIILALAWVRDTHWTMGVSFEQAIYGHNLGGQHREDFEKLIEINLRNIQRDFESQSWITTACIAFFMGTLFTLGFAFHFELAQALFLLIVPFGLTFLLTLRFANRLQDQMIWGEDLYRAYISLRKRKQIIGVFSIAFIAIWSVFQTARLPFL